MANLGDLRVRLGLKSDGFKKGIRDAQKDTEGFGKKLKNMKAGAMAVWAAIGAGVVKFTKDFISATNKINDAWTHTLAGLKAGYHSFLADLSNSTFGIDTSGSGKGGKLGNAFRNELNWWKRIFGNAKDAGEAARQASAAFDAEFELVNSIKVQKEQAKQELNELYTTIRDTTLSPHDRSAAIAKYKAILEPLAQAEIDVYTNMLNEAISSWQAGNSQYLSRKYSTAEVTEFFANYGTNPNAMIAKYGELATVYEYRKGDKQNQQIYDYIVKLTAAKNQMSDIDKEMGRAAVSIKNSLKKAYEIDGKSADKYLKKQLADISHDIEKDLRELELNNLEDFEIWVNAEIQTEGDFGLESVLWQLEQAEQRAKQYGDAIENAIISATQNSMQALTDMMMGVEGADMKNVMAAFLAPFGDTMKQMGSMIMAEGIAMQAFKNSFKTPATAIAAGAALMAVGAAVSSGLQRLTANPTGGGTGASTASSSTTPMNYESTLTVEVVGKISGNDILLSGKKTSDSRNR